MKRKLACACNIAIAVLVAIAWCMMVFSLTDGVLASRGLAAMKYFTVLSNMLEGIAAVVYVVYLVRAQRRNQGIPHAVHLLKYVATVSVGLTFATVVLLFGPLYDYEKLFLGANLFFHLIVPVLAIVEFCLFEHEYPVSWRETAIACIPMIAYGIAYYANILINGVGTWPNTNDWYGFVAMGLQWAPLVFAAMFAATWVIAALIRAANKLFARS